MSVPRYCSETKIVKSSTERVSTSTYQLRISVSISNAHDVVRSAGHWKRKARTRNGASAEARGALKIDSPDAPQEWFLSARLWKVAASSDKFKPDGSPRVVMDSDHDRRCCGANRAQRGAAPSHARARDAGRDARAIFLRVAVCRGLADRGRAGGRIPAAGAERSVRMVDRGELADADRRDRADAARDGRPQLCAGHRVREDRSDTG